MSLMVHAAGSVLPAYCSRFSDPTARNNNYLYNRHLPLQTAEAQLERELP